MRLYDDGLDVRGKGECESLCGNFNEIEHVSCFTRIVFFFL